MLLLKNRLFLSILIITAILILLQLFSFFSISQLKKSNQINDKYFALNNIITELKYDIADGDAVNKRVVYEDEKELLKEYGMDIANAKTHIGFIIANNPDENLKDTIQELNILINQFTDKHKEIIRLYTIGKLDEAKILKEYQNDEMLLNQIDRICNSLQKKYIQSQLFLSKKNEREINFIQIFSLIITLLICTFLAYQTFRIYQEKEKDIQLQNSLKEAEKLAKNNVLIKEQFMANMSHEIRTPLNAIIGFTQRMLKTNLSNEQYLYIDAVNSSSENLLTIVNDILDFSKIEAGMMHFEEISFSLTHLLENIQKIFLVKTQEKKINFSVSIDEKIPHYLMGDSYRVSQIIMNLLANALKFTDTGSIKIIANCIHQTSSYCNIQLQIIDTGIGIQHEKLELIFERFQQANVDTNRKYGGTGLGLSIVKQIVELMNGTISVESKEHSGSIFTVNLGFKIYHNTAKELDKKETNHIYSTYNFQHNVLIVEDNPLNYKLLEMLFLDWNLKYEIAQNGIIAIEFLKSNHYDLILMDIQMPELNGYETTDYIRNKLQLQTPIIAMTAHAIIGEKEKCISHGMNDYITKPIIEDNLYYLILQYLPISKQFTKNSHDKINTNQTIISLDYLTGILKNNSFKINEVLQNYLVEIPEFIQKLESSIATHSYDDIYYISHRMQSSVSFVGIDSIVKPALEEIENLSKQKKSIDKINEIFLQNKYILEQSCIDVNEYIYQKKK